MSETPEERARRLKRQRQTRWRLHKRLSGEQERPPGDDLDGPAAAMVSYDAPGPAAEREGLPAHADAPMFGALRRVTAWSIAEAQRYTELVAGMTPREAITPLRPGASPPASEARLQRQEARQALAALAATPVAYARVVRDATPALDIALEYQALAEGRPSRLDGAVLSEDGKRIILASQPGDDGGPGDDGQDSDSAGS